MVRLQALLTAVVVTLLFVCVWPVASHAERIRLYADLWPPYNAEPGGERPGYIVEILREVFPPAGHTIEYKITPWTRSIRLAEAGEIEGIIGATPLEAPGFVFPKEPLGVIKDVFFTRSDSTWKYAGPGSLDGVRLGIGSDYSYGPTLNEYIETHRDDPRRIHVLGGENPAVQAIEMLQRRRLDAFVSVPEVVRWEEANRGAREEALREAGASPETEQIFVAFGPKGPKSKEYAALLDEGIRRLRKSGRLKEILARYGVEDWVVTSPSGVR